MKSGAALVIGLIIGLVIGAAAVYLAAPKAQAPAGNATAVKAVEKVVEKTVEVPVGWVVNSSFLESQIKPRLKIAGAIAPLFAGLSKVLIISSDDPVCTSFSSALAAELAALGVEAHYRVYSPGNESDAERVARYAVEGGFDAVYLSVGGMYMGNKTLIVDAVRQLLYALAEYGFNGTVIVHAPAMAATNGLRLVARDEVARWLEGRAVRYFVPKLDEGVVELVYARYVNGSLRVEDRRYVRIGEAPRLIGSDALSRALGVRSGLVRLVARYAFVNVSRPLVVVGRDEVCIGLGTALVALLKAEGVSAGLTVVEYGGEPRINASGFDSVYLALGGAPFAVGNREAVAEALKRALMALAESGYSGVVIVHAPAFAATNGLTYVLGDEEIAKWLAGGVEVRFFKFESVNGTRVVRFYRGRVVERDGRYVLVAEPYAEAPIS